MRPQEAESYVFYVFSLRVAEAPGGPRMAQDGPQIRVFYVFPLRVAEPPFSSYVFLRVGGSGTPFGAVRRHCRVLRSGGLLARSYVKTRAASDGAETASV